jgi:hypothetical protein
MIRAIVKWYISRSLDRGVRLPRWVRARIDCDGELRQFESLARRLDDRLRRDAPEWIAIQAKESRDDVRAARPLAFAQTDPAPSRRWIAWAAAACALAAGVVVVLANLPSGGDQVDTPIRTGDGQPVAKVHTEANSALDRQWLIAAWNSGRASIHQIRVHSIGFRDRVTVPKMPDFSTILEPTEIAGSIAGRTAATLDSGIQLQLRQVNSDLRIAVSFFVQRLPASAAKLVGLRSHQRT